MKKLKSDAIFEFGVFLIPFENFFFAPSSGWATITPIVFFIYILFNIKNIVPKKILYFFIIGFFISIVNYFIVGLNFSSTINAYIVLILGIVSFYAFSIYYEKNKNINKVVKILLTSYSISLLCGLLQFISIKYGINFIYKIFNMISKRNYMNAHRVQFTFTEPSFIGMHLYGVLLPIYLISKEKKILLLMIIFAFSSLFFGSGLRIILDTIVICLIFLFEFIKKHQTNILLYLLIPILIIIGLFSYKYLYNNNTRFRNLITGGENGDASAASRFFRINASLKGYKENPLHFIFGYGVGNSTLAIRDGYDLALLEYTNSFDTEVLKLKYSYDDNASYCLYLRMISEYGILWTILFMLFLLKLYFKSNFKYKLGLFLTFLYLYIQFDSFGFYTLWLLILILYYSSNKVLINKKDVDI